MSKKLLAAALAAAFLATGGVAKADDKYELNDGGQTWDVTPHGGTLDPTNNPLSSITGDMQNIVIYSESPTDSGAVAGAITTGGKGITLGIGSTDGTTADAPITLTAGSLVVNAQDTATIFAGSSLTTSGSSTIAYDSTATTKEGKLVVENTATYMNTGTLAYNGVMELDGTFKNTGLVTLGSTASFEKDTAYGAIDNSGTNGKLSTGKGFIIDAGVTDGTATFDSAGFQEMISAIVRGGSNASDANDIGDVVLKGIQATDDDVIFAIDPTDTSVDTALSGNVYLGTKSDIAADAFTIGTDAGGPNDVNIDAQGANLYIRNIKSDNSFDGDFSGREVYIEQGQTYAGTITAYGGKEGKAIQDAAGNNIGTVYFDAKDGKSIDVLTVLDAGRLEVRSNGSSLGLTGNQLSIDAGITYHNGGDIDLSGTNGKLEGSGILDNSGFVSANIPSDATLTVNKDTSIDPNAKIYNIATDDTGALYTGTIYLTDNKGLEGIANAVKVDERADADYNDLTLGGGFGIVDAKDFDINTNISWGATKEDYGDFYWGGATKNHTLTGNIDLGDGVIYYGRDSDNTPDAFTRTINSGSVVKAFEHVADTNVANAGTIDGGLNIADNKAVTNTGTILVGVLKEGETAGSPEVITFNTSGKIDNSQGYMNIGSNAEFDDKGSVINGNIYNNGTGANGKAVIDISANIDTDGIANFTAAVNTANTAGKIGAINVTEGSLGESFVIAGARDGIVTLEEQQKNTVNVDIGTADLVLAGSGNEMRGNIAAGDIEFSSTAGDSEYTGTITARDGDITIRGADTFKDSMHTYQGDVNIANGAIVDDVIAGDPTAAPAGTNPLDPYGNVVAGSGVTFNGDVIATYSATADEGGDVIAKNSVFEGIVRADQSLTAVNNTFKDHVFAGNIVNGITGSEFYKTLTVNTGDVKTYGAESIFRDRVTVNDGNLTINSKATFANGIDLWGVNDAGTAYDKKTTVTGNGNVTLGGDLNTDFYALTASTVNIAYDHVDANREFKMYDGTTLDFREVADKNGDPIDGQVATLNIGEYLGAAGRPATEGIVDLASSTKFLVDEGAILTADGVHELITGMELGADGVTYTNFTLDGALGTTTIADVNNFLDEKSIQTFGYSGYYGFLDPEDPTTIAYTHVVATPDQLADQFKNAMDQQGMGGKEGIVSDNTYNTLYNEFTFITEDDMAVYEANGVGDLAKLFTGAAGRERWYDLKNRPDEAYALHQWMNGQDLAGAVEAVQDTARQFNRAITNRGMNMGHLLGQTQYDECGRVIEDCGGYKNRVWAGYTGLWGKRDSNSWDKGYKYDANGFNIGYDHVTSSGVGFGAAFGYSSGDYKNRGSLGNSSEIDNYSFGLFASYNHCSGIFTTISGTYTYSDYDMRSKFADPNMLSGKTAGFSGWDSADFHGNTWSVGGEMGYDFKPIAGLTVTPTMGLYYYDTSTNRFGTSAGRYGMKYKQKSLELPVEVTAKYDIALGCDSTLSLLATAGYTYNFHNKGVRQNSFYTVASESLMGGDNYQKPGRSAWNFGGGAQFRYRNMDVGVHYEYYGRKDYRSHNLNANVGFSF